MYEFKMPALGADIESAKLIAWNVKPGDSVKKGDIIAVIETSKSTLDVESWQDGVIKKILLEPGPEEIPIGTTLAILNTDSGEKKSAETVKTASQTEEARKISPAARKRIQEFHLDPSQILGTGPDGAIQLQDVEKIIAAQTPAAAVLPAEELDKKQRMRQAIAAAMERSHREIPHYYLETQISMEHALEWIKKQNQDRPPESRFLPIALLIKATALALKNVPELNGFYLNEVFQASESVHVGIAVSLREGGLIVPALHDADQKSLEKLMADIQDLVKRVRHGNLKSSEISDSTVTVTNLGEEGVEKVFGIIYPPQVALIGFGRIFETPVVENNQIVSQRVITATLSADHRVSDGHRGGIFLRKLNRYLQEPEKM